MVDSGMEGGPPSFAKVVMGLPRKDPELARTEACRTSFRLPRCAAARGLPAQVSAQVRLGVREPPDPCIVFARRLALAAGRLCVTSSAGHLASHAQCAPRPGRERAVLERANVRRPIFAAEAPEPPADHRVGRADVSRRKIQLRPARTQRGFRDQPQATILDAKHQDHSLVFATLQQHRGHVRSMRGRGPRRVKVQHDVARLHVHFRVAHGYEFLWRLTPEAIIS